MLRPDPETDFLAFSLADAITSSLSGLQSLVVRSSLAAARFASDSPDLKAIATERGSGRGARRHAAARRRSAARRHAAHRDAVGDRAVVAHRAGAGGRYLPAAGRPDRKIVESLSLPLTARERRMLKQDVPSSRGRVRAVPARQRDEPRHEAVARGARSVRTVRPGGSALRAGLGAARTHAPDDRQVRRRRRRRSGSRRRRRPSSGRSSSIPTCPSREHLYAHLEVDLGRAEQSMVRLLRRARERSADPELFAGLSHACRYCGLLQASLAAAEQARRLDPKIRISAGHTCFMLGDYAVCSSSSRKTRTCGTSCC